MQSKWMPLVLTLCLAMVLSLLVSKFKNWKSRENFGTAYNDEREGLGIPPIGRKWYFSTDTVKVHNIVNLHWFKYENPEKVIYNSTILPQHISKTVVLTNGKRSLERDTYYFKSNGVFQTLTLSYDFDETKWGSSLEVDYNADILMEMNAEITENLEEISLNNEVTLEIRNRVINEVSKKYQPRMKAPSNTYFEVNALQKADSILASWKLRRVGG